MANELRIVNSPGGLNIRQQPTTQSAVAGRLVNGSEIIVVKGQNVEADGYTWLKLADGRGWVAASLTKVSDPEVEFRLVKAGGSLNIRSAPSSQGNNVVGSLPDGAVIKVIAGQTAQGDGHTWLKLADGRGWVAGELTEITDKLPPTGGLQMRGVNIDLNSPDTSPANMSPFGYCRFVYNLSQKRGNEDFSKVSSFNTKMENYISQGVTPIVIFNHEFYGEGHFNWDTMRSATPDSLAQWDKLTDRQTQLIGTLVKEFGSRIVYEIWNEPDQGSVAAVQVPPIAFARMLDKCLAAIQAIAPAATVIAGGLVSGLPSYWEQTQAAMKSVSKLAGVALHPYGRGATGQPAQFEDFGSIQGLLNDFGRSKVQKFWITEWGVLGPADRSEPPNVSEQDVSNYVKRFLRASESDPRVAATVYFALKDGMHNGFGLNRRDNSKKDLMWKAF